MGCLTPERLVPCGVQHAGQLVIEVDAYLADLAVAEAAGLVGGLAEGQLAGSV
jgi:hypothetical protein